MPARFIELRFRRQFVSICHLPVSSFHLTRTSDFSVAIIRVFLRLGSFSFDSTKRKIYGINIKCLAARNLCSDSLCSICTSKFPYTLLIGLCLNTMNSVQLIKHFLLSRDRIIGSFCIAYHRQCLCVRYSIAYLRSNLITVNLLHFVVIDAVIAAYIERM